MQAVEGCEKVVSPPAQKQTASAPPTPQHPEGTPRALSPSEEFPPPPADHPHSVTMTDAWMPGAGSAFAKDGEAPLDQELLPGVPQTVEKSSPKGYPFPTSQAAGTPEAMPPTPGQANSPPQPLVDSEKLAAALQRRATDGCIGGGSLDIPLDEVLKQATEAFGQIASALSSTKWDRRVQALKGITTVLKGLDIKGSSADANIGAAGARGLQLRDHARCFNASCLILHIVMKDKVLPVLLAAHELYRVTFEHGRTAITQAEASRAIGSLFPHILAKLGELNIRLHESACACVLFTASQPCFGTTVVLRRLLDVVEGRGDQQVSALRGQQKMRVHYGVLQAVEMLIRQSPGRRVGDGDEADAVSTWTPSDIAPFIVGGMHADSVTGARVQQAALGLAMSVYATLGKNALLPVLEQLSPVAKDILVARLEEEGEDMEDLDGDDADEDCVELTGMDSLCILGVGLRAPAELAISKPNTTDGEECLMDEILEDTGLVFDGQGLGKKKPFRSVVDEELNSLNLDEDDLEQLLTAASMPDLGTRCNRQALLS